MKKTATLLRAALLAAPLVLCAAAQGATPAAMLEALNAAKADKKGVTLYVQGQAISGRVTRADAESVELSSREAQRIIVRTERVDAVAAN